MFMLEKRKKKIHRWVRREKVSTKFGNNAGYSSHAADCRDEKTRAADQNEPIHFARITNNYRNSL